MECADGYSWPTSEPDVCLTSDSYWELLADCILEDSETTTRRLAEFYLLVTPLGTSDGASFTSQCAYGNMWYNRRVFVLLMYLDWFDVEVSDP